MWIKILAAADGKFVSQVRETADGVETTIFESAEYVTRQMANADAKCWIAFHGKVKKVTDYSINVDDTVETLQKTNGIPVRTWTGPQFAKWLEGTLNRFPEMTFRVGTRFDHRETTGDDFFLITRKTPATISERCFVVRKGN